MDGKPDVNSKPAQTYKSAPVVCQLPEPCDDEQLQMVGWYNPREHTTAMIDYSYNHTSRELNGPMLRVKNSDV